MKSLNKLLPLTITIVLLIALLSSCTDKFGKEVKIKKSSVYYKDVPESDAKRIGDFLYNVGYFNEESDISVQLSKPKDSLEFRFVVDKNKLKPDFDDQYLMIGSALSDSILNGQPVIVFLADTDMKDIKRVGVALPSISQNETNNNVDGAMSADIEAMLKSTEKVAATFGSNVKEVKGNKLYYDNNVEPNRVNALIEYLTQGGYFDTNSGHIAVLIKQNNKYIFKEAFTEPQINDKETTEALENVATSIKQTLFNSDSFSFEVCNLKFQPQLSFVPGAK